MSGSVLFVVYGVDETYLGTSRSASTCRRKKAKSGSSISSARHAWVAMPRSIWRRCAYTYSYPFSFTDAFVPERHRDQPPTTTRIPSRHRKDTPTRCADAGAGRRYRAVRSDCAAAAAAAAGRGGAESGGSGWQLEGEGGVKIRCASVFFCSFRLFVAFDSISVCFFRLLGRVILGMWDAFP